MVSKNNPGWVHEIRCNHVADQLKQPILANINIIYRYIHMGISMFIYTYIYTYIHLLMHTQLYAYMCYACFQLYLHMYIWFYICTYSCCCHLYGCPRHCPRNTVDPQPNCTRQKVLGWLLATATWPLSYLGCCYICFWLKVMLIPVTDTYIANQIC